MIELIRMQVVRNMANFGDGLRGKVADAFHLFAQIDGRVFFGERELGAVFDDEQILAETVVQFGGDARALGFLRRNELESVFRARQLFALHGTGVIQFGLRLSVMSVMNPSSANKSPLSEKIPRPRSQTHFSVPSAV